MSISKSEYKTFSTHDHNNTIMTVDVLEISLEAQQKRDAARINNTQRSSSVKMTTVSSLTNSMD